MDLRGITDRIINGGLKSFVSLGNKTDIHPSDVAKVFNTLPADMVVQSFGTFPEKKKIILFAYVGHFLQKKIIESDRHRFVGDVKRFDDPNNVEKMQTRSRYLIRPVCGYFGGCNRAEHLILALPQLC